MSEADIPTFRNDVRFTPNNGHGSAWARCPKSADFVAKVFSGWRTKILRAADASSAQRREGPYRFIQNRSWTSVVPLKSDAAAEKSKDQLWRDFSGCSIFDFCNNICQYRTHLPAANSIMSQLSRTIDLRGFSWQAFCSKVSRSDPLRSNAAAIFQSYLKNGLLH
jgi:hypothetical protein